MCKSLANIIKTIINNSTVYQVVARLTTTWHYCYYHKLLVYAKDKFSVIICYFCYFNFCVLGLHNICLWARLRQEYDIIACLFVLSMASVVGVSTIVRMAVQGELHMLQDACVIRSAWGSVTYIAITPKVIKYIY